MGDLYDIDREMMADFLDESIDSFAAIPGLFVELEANPANLKIIEAIFRPVHSLKGNAAYFGLMKIKSLAHEMESVLDLLRKSRLVVSQVIVDYLLEGTDAIVSILDAARSSGREVVDEAHYATVLKHIKSLLESEAGPAPAEVLEKWVAIRTNLEELRLSGAFKSDGEKEKLDQIIDMVEELAPPAARKIKAPGSKFSGNNPLQTLIQVVKAAPGEMTEKEKIQIIRGLIRNIEERAQVEEAKKIICDAREELEIFVSKLGFDPMLQESLLEMADTLTTLQNWDEVVEEQNPLKALTAMIKTPPEDLPPKEQADAVLQYLQQLGPLAVSEEAGNIIVQAVEEFDLFISKIGYDEMLKEGLLDHAANLEKLQDWRPVVDEPEKPVTKPVETEKALPEPEIPETLPSEIVATEEAKPQSKKEKEPSRTMRVSEESIDAFLGYVGELIAVDEMFRYIHSEMVRNDIDLQITSSFLRVVNTFTKLSDDLQKSIMEIRKVSVRPMLQKTQRIVRDIANNHAKIIETTIEGGDTQIDRSLVDTLEAPLVHMVRNAADHGIELPGDRRSGGKEESGNIVVSVRESEDEIILAISDDGRGLNYERIKEKALRLGLLRPDDRVTEDRLADLIFSSGFSTADQVTDVSGRGVGMDAVKRSVEDAGGQVILESTPGKGTVFRIHLPKTVGTQILNSFVVHVGQERFVLPMDRISGSFKPEAQWFHRLPNGALCIKRNENIMPIVSLSGPYFGDPGDLIDGILITMESKLTPFAFYVDSIIGMQKVVLRGIPWFDAAKFSGAAIMGDGRVSMIVNVAHLESETLL